jgi:hypothetical protein
MDCGRCDKPIPEGGRKDRRYCSETCRKGAWLDAIVAYCACGAGLKRCSVRRGARQCQACERAGRSHAWQARALVIADLWAEGKTQSEIAAAVGLSVGHYKVETARIRKWRPGLLPHRRTPEQVARIREGQARAARRAA